MTSFWAFLHDKLRNIDLRLVISVSTCAAAVYTGYCGLRKLRSVNAAAVVGTSKSISFCFRQLELSGRQCKRLRSEVDALLRKLRTAEAASQRSSDEKVRMKTKLGCAELAYTELSDRLHELKESLEAEKKKRDLLQAARQRDVADGRNIGSILRSSTNIFSSG